MEEKLQKKKIFKRKQYYNNLFFTFVLFVLFVAKK